MPETPAFYAPRQIGILALVFGPFAGTWLLWRNWRTAGRKDLALQAAIAGVTLTMIVSKAADLLPDGLWVILAFCFTYSGLFAVIATKWQGASISSIKASGIRRGSTWRFCRLGLLLMAAYYVADSLIS